jgi:hypothetical protein
VPWARDVVRIVNESPPEPELIVREKPPVAVLPAESTTPTVKWAVPVVEGVPLKVPSCWRIRPAGSSPAVTAQVYGELPPEAAKR